MVRRPDAIHVVPNGVDFPLVDAAQGPPVFVPGTFNVLYTGSHSISDALDPVLDAARLLWEQGHQNIRFHFMGEGDHKERLVQRCTEEGIENVSFHPPVPKHEVFVWMKQADALIINKMNVELYRHGVSFNKLFDYMACGRPTVYAVPSDLMERANGGITCTPSDPVAIAEAVIQLEAMGAQARDVLGAQARAYVETHHNMDMLAQRFEAAIEAAVANA